MMDENLEETLPQETNGLKSTKTDVVNLAENTLQVDISDALSERERVKFTVHTVTNLPDFLKKDFSVSRQHEEFIWLHDRFNEDDAYAGFIIPPPPPRPDFDSSREKLQKLGEGEGNMTNEEFKKMKQELEAEYLAIFKKTVAMHEVFLTRLAQHPVFRKDNNFKVFLEYEQDLSVRTKNKKERVGDLFKNFNKSTDEMLLSATQKDVDDFFEKEKNFIIEYHSAIKESSWKSDKMTSSHKNVADCYIQLYTGLCQLGTIEGQNLEKFIIKISETFEKMRKIEGRLSSDEDLKLSDTLKYYQRECTAAKNLLFRRLRCLANYEQSNKNLDRARAKNKDVNVAELAQQHSCEVFEIISEKAKEELADFRIRRVAAFKKNFVELSELEIKHAKSQIQLLKNCLQSIQTDEDQAP